MIAAGIDIVHRTDWTAMAARERLDTMDTLETDRRLTLAISTAIAATIADEPLATLGDLPKKLIADTLRITPAEAATRLTQAALVRERSTLTGEPLAPHLPATAKAWNKGLLDAAHLAEIITFFDEIPADTPLDVQETSEKFLADKATQLRPDQLKKVAKKLAQTINPDGKFSEQDRIRKSGFRWEAQRADGMSKGVLWATPQLRAHLDAFFAKYAGYGMSMPDQEPDDEPDADADPRRLVPTPRTTAIGPPLTNPHSPTPKTPQGPTPTDPTAADTAGDTDDAADTADTADDASPPSPGPKPAVTDFRTPSQRRHDALNYWARSILGNPALGTHHGLPVTVVATTTLAELQAAAGHALTATGTLIANSDLITMAAQSYRYLQIFVSDADRRTVDFYRARRCANGDQWLALFGRDRGCTRPTATAPPKTPKPTTAPTSPPTAKPMSTS